MESVTSSNIISAFTAADLHLFDPECVLKKLARPCTPPDTQYRPRTPTSIIGMQKLAKQVKQRQRQMASDLNQTSQALQSNEAARSIKSSMAQLFSPAKVQCIRVQMTAAEAAKKDEQAQKEDAKLQRAILEEQREADLIQQRREREAARQAAKQQEEMDKAARAAQRQIDKDRRDSRKAQEQKEKEERAAAQLQSQLDKNKIEESKNHLPNQESRPSISQRVAKSRFQSPARVPTDPLPEDSDDIAIPTDLITACLLNLPPLKISRSGRVIKPNKHLLN
ncbi:hypothetical protein ACJ73_08802 [Blastomyces percursus]|uniref:Uncharacterized protein n=1 Tax=Blastomyces percursus TaxID=1658174 RepID=A0A1J9QQ73_9EURO|nr:hypothetical protein ACJ73_08802 [Blastomyces percursus]